MRKLATLVLFVCTLSSISFSSDMLAGLKAYQEGRYEEAYENWIYFARRGNAEAQYNIANLYRRGEGVVADGNKAYIWMLFASEAGLASAQYNLGVMLLKGDGVPMSQVRAEYWLKESAKQNHAGAIKLLNDLSKPTPVASPSPQPTSIPTPSPSPTAIATPSPTPTTVPSPAPVATPVVTPSATPKPVATPTPTPSASPTPKPTPVKPPVVPTPTVNKIEVRFGSFRATESWANVLQRYKTAFGSLLTGRVFRVLKKEGESADYMWVYVGKFSSEEEAAAWCKDVQKISNFQVCYLD